MATTIPVTKSACEQIMDVIKEFNVPCIPKHEAWSSSSNLPVYYWMDWQEGPIYVNVDIRIIRNNGPRLFQEVSKKNFIIWQIHESDDDYFSVEGPSLEVERRDIFIYDKNNQTDLTVLRKILSGEVVRLVSNKDQEVWVELALSRR